MVRGRMVQRAEGLVGDLMPGTYAEQLTAINAAIRAIEEGAQSYSIGTRRVERADLGTLYDERRKLRAAAEAEENGGTGGIYYAAFDRR